MPERWTLSRAGITNVYQYDDETLHFGGGRLLLRGVNGSGKSTAMNMLLPFLLEADTRRIDAAGEQSGVLRSWMLSGRDDAQPVGYLWVEFVRGEDHLVCGCGIKANRNTDRVTTWWFVTGLRPGIDFSLVENRIPRSVDSLRATLGDRAVYPSNERGAYRSELRSRLYGGADIDQHIRLLHVIRNPRVGDRIDLDLPQHLQDALPPLSEPALDDAAQPLEDLEEHRRNVENLADTSRALSALGGVYQDYARTELHGRTAEALGRAGDARRQEAAVAEARRLVAQAEAELADAAAETQRLEREIERIEHEADALRASTAYESGQELESLRQHVKDLEEDRRQAVSALERAEERRRRATDAVQSAHATMESDRDEFLTVVTDLGDLASRTGLTERPPDLPPVPTRPEVATPLPDGDWELQPMRAKLADLGGGVLHRSAEVDEIGALLDRVDSAERDLQLAERERTREEERAVTATDRHATARRKLTEATEEFRFGLAAWWQRLAEAAQHRSLPIAAPGEIPVADLPDRRQALLREAVAAADSLSEHHHGRIAHLAARADRESDEVTERLQLVEELDRMELPVPPVLPWQRPEGRARLAELIDFSPDLDPDECVGLEAAMEAAGLLGAELTNDGDLELETGELITAGGAPVEAPLSELVATAIPDGVGVEPRQVRAVLDSISTDPASAAATVIGVDGTFRIGALAGRHHKDVVEHIGSGARKAALERRREEAATRLAEARAALAETEQQIGEQRQWLEETLRLRAEVPAAGALSDAVVMATRAEADLAESHEQVALAQERERAAETARAAAVGESERLAADLHLPASRDGLARIQGMLAEARNRVDALTGRVTVLERSHSAWRAAADEWREAGTALDEARAHRDDIGSRYEAAAARLATLEDAVGLEYREVLAALEQCDQDKDSAKRLLQETRRRHDKALEARATHSQSARDAESRHRSLEREAVEELARLRQALVVDGLADAAGDDGGLEDLPGVEESARGLAALAEAVRSATPPPTAEVTAEGVRQSLRQRRDTLGAGWDAEDRQPDPTLPLTVEINGPLGRMTLPAAAEAVESHSRHQAALLTTKQDQALRNLLQGLIAREVSDKLVASRELVTLMNDRLAEVSTSHGVGVQLRWRRRDDLDPNLDPMIDLLGKPPDLRTPEEDDRLIDALSGRIGDARAAEPELAYRDLIRSVLDYRQWHEMSLYITRAGDTPRKLSRRTPLSEGEKKIVSYLALFAAVAASWDSVAGAEPAAPRFVLLDDAFAKVSEDNHAQLFGLLVEMDLDFIATSERLWGTHSTVPELAITEVVRDADMGVILLEHARWDGRRLEEAR